MNKNSKHTYDSALRLYTNIVPKEKALKTEGLSIFIKYLNETKYSQSTQRLYFYAVLKTLKDLGVEIDNLEPPIIEEDEICRHIYNSEEIFRLITSAKYLGGIYAKAMALSSTYGIRRTEIANMPITNIDIKNKIIKIKSAKKGKTTKHKIPEAILKYLDNDIQFLSNSGMSRVFDVIAKHSKLKVPNSGWHSIRRALVTELLINNVTQEIVLGFMRWKTRTILDIYHIRNPKEDLIVFENHPFLYMWK